MAIVNLQCPTCAAEGKEIPLQTQFGVFGYSCGSGHRFLDTEELMAMKPKPLTNPPAAPAKLPGQNDVQIAVTVHSSVQARLSNRFGANLNANVAAVLGAMADADSFVVPGEDANRISQHLGQKVGDAGKLVGILYELKTDRDGKQVELNNLRNKGGAASHPVSETAVVVDLGDGGYMEQLEEKAKANGMETTQFIRNLLIFALTNSWC